ncbi:MAG: O-antigen ligase family protein [SAR202 cluster bacterium]|nr:O-antigen ligase family protein [SAR202 cluster bacterium]
MTALVPTAPINENSDGMDTPIPAEQTVRLETPSESPSVDNGFFQFTGRTAVWKEGWKYVKRSPLLGYGFNADRLLLGTHMHNAVMHSLIQAGFVGAIPFISAGILAWLLFFRIVRRLTLIPNAHKCLVIQCGGVLAFLTMRSFPESTGAFFGVDWLVLALVMLYLQVVNYWNQPIEVNGDHGKRA